jgi:hypothetical protein
MIGIAGTFFPVKVSDDLVEGFLGECEKHTGERG